MAINGLNETTLGGFVPSAGDTLIRALQASVTGVPDAGLAIGTVSTAKVKQVNAVDYEIFGLKKTQVAAQEVAFTATTHNIPIAATGTTNERWYCIYLDNAGTATILAGDVALGSVGAKKPIKGVPYDACVLGFVKISVAPTATSGFVAGTTALSATGVTATYVSIKRLWLDNTFAQS